MVEKFERKIGIEQEEERIDNSVFKKRSSAHSFKGWMIGKIKQVRDDENLEVLYLLNEIYKKYMEFHKIESKQLLVL